MKLLKKIGKFILGVGALALLFAFVPYAFAIAVGVLAGTVVIGGAALIATTIALRKILKDFEKSPEFKEMMERIECKVTEDSVKTYSFQDEKTGKDYKKYEYRYKKSDAAKTSDNSLLFGWEQLNLNNNESLGRQKIYTSDRGRAA